MSAFEEKHDRDNRLVVIAGTTDGNEMGQRRFTAAVVVADV